LARARASARSIAGWHLGAPLTNGWGRLEGVASHDVARPTAGKRWLTGQHLEQHAGQRILIAATIDFLVAARLLGAHVSRRADRETRQRARLGRSFFDRARDAEVGHQRLAFLQQDVLRLDIAMQDVAPVGVIERRRHGPGDRHRLVDVEALDVAQPFAQRGACDIRHDVVEQWRCVVAGANLTGIVQRQDVRVRQTGGDANFLQETQRRILAADDTRIEDLDGDRPCMAQVAGAVHDRHAAVADLLLDRIARAERRPDALLQIGHRSTSRSRSRLRGRAWGAKAGRKRDPNPQENGAAMAAPLLLHFELGSYIPAIVAALRRRRRLRPALRTTAFRTPFLAARLRRALRTVLRPTALRTARLRRALRATLRTALRRTALRTALRRTALRATLRRTALRTALLRLALIMADSFNGPMMPEWQSISGVGS
jgi:hypothetical protein